MQPARRHRSRLPVVGNVVPLRVNGVALARRPRRRAMLGALVLSAAAHVALLVWTDVPTRQEATPPVPLEVVLVQAPAAAEPRPAATPPAVRAEARPRPKSPAAPVRAAEAPRRVPPPAAPVPPPAETLRTEAPSAPAAPPAAPPLAAPPAPAAEPRADAAAAAAGAGSAASAPRAGPTTPPSFNAAYLRNPPPRYPLVARRNGEQGTVTLRVRVTRDGLPESVAVERSSGSAALDAAALATVREWRFVPAQQNGQPVEATVLVPIVFRLQDGAS